MNKQDAFLVFVIICFLITAGFAIYYKGMYNIAVKESAKDIVTALEMVTACKMLSNVTDKQITEVVMKWYIDKNE